MKLDLTNNEETTLIGALYTAIERYAACAKAISEEAAFPQISRTQICNQFDRQAADCRALIRKIED